MTLSIDNQLVHGLWIGSQLSSIELLTLHSFTQQGHHFYLWTYEEIKNEIPHNVTLKNANEIIPYEKIFRYKYKNQFGHGKGSLAGFSDIFRYKLLYEYGGWWVDMDVTCLKPLNFTTPYVFRTHQKLAVVGNIIKCPKGSNLMKDCFEQAIKEIDANNKDWNKPINLLYKMIEKYQLTQYIYCLSNPDSWRLIRKFLYKKYPINKTNWYVIHWVNEEWRRNRIAKDVFIKNTTFYQLLIKYDVAMPFVSLKKRMIYRLQLSFFYASLLQLPSFVVRNLKGLWNLLLGN